MNNQPAFRYPRSRCRRDSFFSLSGEWDFCFCAQGEPLFDRTVRVPFPPESKASAVGERHAKGELLYYRKTFSLPKDFTTNDGTVLLHFGAVDQIAEVTFNGTTLGKHEGGYLPFSFSIGSLLKEENLLEVKVRDDLDLAYPYGKQKEKRGGMWYTPFSGIWQEVWIEHIPRGGIFDIRVLSDDTSAHITVKSESKALTLTYLDGEETVSLPFSESITVTPKSARLWSPEAPHLYEFTVSSESDVAASYFALRRLSVQKANGKARFFLNGKPYLLHGVLDQGYFQDGIVQPTDPLAFEKDILAMKELGFNMLRKHIKVEPASFYEACDRLGMIVFQDAVNNGRYSFFWQTALPTVGMKSLPKKMTPKSRFAKEFFRLHTKEMLEELCFYPSVLLFTIFNEGWGQADEDAIYDELKALYPYMIFDTASGWFLPKRSDVRSDHVYFKKVKPNYKKEEKPVILSEFGGYSYPVAGHRFNADRNYGYGTCTDGDALMARIEALYYHEIVPAVKEGLCALVYTQLSDVEDETNGLYTYDREVCKTDKERMQKIARTLFDTYRAACKEKP